MKEALEDILCSEPRPYFLGSNGQVVVDVDVSSKAIADFYNSDKPTSQLSRAIILKRTYQNDHAANVWEHLIVSGCFQGESSLSQASTYEGDNGEEVIPLSSEISIPYTILGLFIILPSIPPLRAFERGDVEKQRD